MPSKSKQVKPPQTKRGRGRPSKIQKVNEETLAALLTAVAFIQSLGDEVSESWLEKNGYETRAQLKEREQRNSAEKRAALEKTINDAQLELAALGVPCTVTTGEGLGVKIRTTDCAS